MNRNLKNYRHMWRQHFPIFQNTKFRVIKKASNLGPKMAYFGIFGLSF